MSKRKKKQRRDTWQYGWYDRPVPSRQELTAHLKPLLSQIERVDCVVELIRRGDGCVRDLQILAQYLAEPFHLPGPSGRNLALARPADIRHALLDLSRDLHLEIHAMPDRFPSYLLCRIHSDWETPDTIMDELYVSSRSDFFPDERFVVLMRCGRSRTFLRLSTFREKLRAHLALRSDDDVDETQCDEILQATARLVIGAAWHEDQRLPFHVADVFGLAQFRAALELVAFILGSDLYKVSTALRHGDDTVIAFFEHVYQNEPLAELLNHLHRDGTPDIPKLEQRATETFVALNAAFSDFLSTAGALRDLESLELYRIVLGCFYSLREVAEKDTWTPKLAEATNLVEAGADQCLHGILATL